MTDQHGAPPSGTTASRPTAGRTVGRARPHRHGFSRSGPARSFRGPRPRGRRPPNPGARGRGRDPASAGYDAALVGWCSDRIRLTGCASRPAVNAAAVGGQRQRRGARRRGGADQRRPPTSLVDRRQPQHRRGVDDVDPDEEALPSAGRARPARHPGGDAGHPARGPRARPPLRVDVPRRPSRARRPRRAGRPPDRRSSRRSPAPAGRSRRDGRLIGGAPRPRPRGRRPRARPRPRTAADTGEPPTAGCSVRAARSSNAPWAPKSRPSGPSAGSQRLAGWSSGLRSTGLLGREAGARRGSGPAGRERRRSRRACPPCWTPTQYSRRRGWSAAKTTARAATSGW